ncbi:hypothetical protein CVT30_33180 [Streptomyces sp. AMCC400023]|nr:hypothetical protein CVT30_33180 [Streptomyces sp. AMCC400023]
MKRPREPQRDLGRLPVAGREGCGFARSRDGRDAVQRPGDRVFAQLGTGARDPATRPCAMSLKAFGEITDPTKPSPFVRELGRHSFE